MVDKATWDTIEAEHDFECHYNLLGAQIGALLGEEEEIPTLGDWVWESAEEDEIRADDAAFEAEMAEAAEWDYQEETKWDKWAILCSLCNHVIRTPGTAHLHRGRWICDGCWDDRLKITE